MILTTLSSVNSISQENWDRLNPDRHPFLMHSFLSALEQSGSVSDENGWVPHHLVILDEEPDGLEERLEAAKDASISSCVAAMPLYLKGHSQGEYVFDHSWAHAWQRAGGQYYPKLLSAIPFTPVTGQRLLSDPQKGIDQVDYKKMLLEGLKELVKRHGISGGHINFLTETERSLAIENGYSMRMHHQYHWTNDGYASFHDFLGALNSRKRKSIRKEREKLTKMGISFQQKTGDMITEDDWDHFYRFYTSTYDRKWGSAYLSRDFFSQVGQTMQDQILLVTAELEGETVAGALNFFNDTHIYGRNWGCDIRFKFLHFECCYYQAIDFAIQKGIETVEAGTQGEHKIQRGYLPQRTWSAHYMNDPGFQQAIDRFLVEERNELEAIIDHLSEQSPFRVTD